jgi:hypothetical protein
MASKRSATQTKSGGGARRGKSKAKQGVKDLDVRKAKEIRGGVGVEALTLKQK